MRLPPAIIASTEEALRDVLRFTAAADMVLSRYFREHPRLGGRERGVPPADSAGHWGGRAQHGTRGV